MPKINPSEITPEHIYVSRRKFIKGVSALVAGSFILGACGDSDPAPTLPPGTDAIAGPRADELGNELTSYQAIANYCNFYEFTTRKEGVAGKAQDFKTSPWTLTVGGLVNKPRTFDLDDLAQFAVKERIYRMRCVEAWSMVIPWVGIPLASMIKQFEPNSNAKYVRFKTLYDPRRMPGQQRRILGWPYEEGLTIEEAMHPLTLVAVGLYGRELPNQNGAPMRLVVPWKYGFKSIKAIAEISFTRKRPLSSWEQAIPAEYGFYANVNPEVSHPRWSQAKERPIGASVFAGKKATLMFNGYGDEVASLYTGLDLRKNY